MMQDSFAVATPERVSFTYPVAGIGVRFLAQAIDQLALTPLAFLAALVAGVLGEAYGSVEVALLVWSLLTIVTFFGYFFVLEALWGGRTVGKHTLQIRVVADGGQPARFSQVAIRNLVRVVDFLPGLYGIGLVSAFFSRDGKRLGDWAAGTVVVRDRDWIPLPALGAPYRGAAPQAPAGEALTVDRDLGRFLAQYLSRRRSLTLEARRQLALLVLPRLQQLVPQELARGDPVVALDALAERYARGL